MPKADALIVIDVQQGFDDLSWGPRNNPHCEANIGRLLEAWRSSGMPIVLVRHDSASPTSPLRPGQPGNDFKEGVAGRHDVLVTKTVNSAFLGEPNLDSWLRGEGIDAVTICGITTNHCCETTARMAGNLGYVTRFVLDATHTFDRRSRFGDPVPAAELARVTAVNLDGEFAQVCVTDDVISSLRQS